MVGFKNIFKVFDFKIVDFFLFSRPFISKLAVLLHFQGFFKIPFSKGHQSYTGARKDPTSKQKFDGLCPISLEPLVLQISYIPHWKALIFSFLEV